MSNSYKIFEGKQVGYLTILYSTAKRKKSSIIWICKCACGNIVEKSTSELNAYGSRKSCNFCKIPRKKTTPKGYAGITRILQQYKQNSKNRKLDFNLSREDFEKLIIQNCFYCGDFPQSIMKDTRYNVTEETKEYSKFIYNGLDRLNNNKGYILDNVVPCCISCNIAKHDKTLKEFTIFVKKIYEHSIKNNNWEI